MILSDLRVSQSKFKSDKGAKSKKRKTAGNEVDDPGITASGNASVVAAKRAKTGEAEMEDNADNVETIPEPTYFEAAKGKKRNRKRGRRGKGAGNADAKANAGQDVGNANTANVANVANVVKPAMIPLSVLKQTKGKEPIRPTPAPAAGASALEDRAPAVATTGVETNDTIKQTPPVGPLESAETSSGSEPRRKVTPRSRVKKNSAKSGGGDGGGEGMKEKEDELADPFFGPTASLKTGGVEPANDGCIEAMEELVWDQRTQIRMLRDRNFQVLPSAAEVSTMPGQLPFALRAADDARPLFARVRRLFGDSEEICRFAGWADNRSGRIINREDGGELLTMLDHSVQSVRGKSVLHDFFARRRDYVRNILEEQLREGAEKARAVRSCIYDLHEKINAVEYGDDRTAVHHSL
ncbi:hypothetical protein HK101_004884 [Irineochytrium annulatum]|nr:hypothetical protein HK101_004884 [Irineochytrium annulatum]